MKTAFLTGGTGFLGLNLVEQLVEQNWQIIALHRPTSNLARLKKFPVNLVVGELADTKRLIDLMPENVDAVFHLASNTSVWKKNNRQQIEDNVTGTHNMIHAASVKKVQRFIYTSTWATFGTEHAMINESTEQTGMSSWINYIKTKSLAEHAVKDAVKHGLPAIIINPSHIIGRYDTEHWAKMILLVLKNQLPGIPPGAGSFCAAKEVALAHINAANRGKIGENYLLGGANASFYDVIQSIGKITQRKVPQKTTPRGLLKMAAHFFQLISNFTQREPDITPEVVEMVCQQTFIDSHKAQDELGYQPTRLEIMLNESYAWLKQEKFC